MGWGNDRVGLKPHTCMYREGVQYMNCEALSTGENHSSSSGLERPEENWLGWRFGGPLLIQTPHFPPKKQ